MNIAIIGSAGRGSDGARWNKSIYTKAFHWLKAELADKGIWSATSGGAAYADHLLISLVLKGLIDPKVVTLHFPCTFISGVKGYLDTGNRDFIKNPGGTLNYYHRLFSSKMEADTLKGIQRALDMGVQINDSYHTLPGSRLHARNLGVGMNRTHLYALTFGEGNVPKAGGSLHTWLNSNASEKIHISLSSLI